MVQDSPHGSVMNAETSGDPSARSGTPAQASKRARLARALRQPRLPHPLDPPLLSFAFVFLFVFSRFVLC